MAGLADNVFLDPLLREPLLRAKREDSHDTLFAPITVASSKLDISPFGLLVVLCLMKSKGHSFRHGCKNAKCPDRGREPGDIPGMSGCQRNLREVPAP